MRTTITIAEDLLQKTKDFSGKKGHSEAIVTSIRDYIAMKERLAFLNKLYSRKLPHSLKRIKMLRKKRRWSS